jgi:hypothetical protein
MGGRPLILLDASLPIDDRISVLAGALATCDVTSIHMPPAVRARIYVGAPSEPRQAQHTSSTRVSHRYHPPRPSSRPARRLIGSQMAVGTGMNPNGYPLQSTRRSVLGRIAIEPAFAVECVRILDAGARWMASHRSRAAKLMATLAAGAPTPTEYAEATELAARYGKTLARVFRERELAARPELGAQAAVFGVAPLAPAAPTSEAREPLRRPASPCS